ncbi:unnamed protein product [Dovyalis caffra]|uniref:Uncharacterized protein n=1 Tax=Dovyalis caffra TaxID=77055 RepID=A0AAV1RMR2_9ROSI|nr:unnamed protein product [Dovyalis caffra]
MEVKRKDQMEPHDWMCSTARVIPQSSTEFTKQSCGTTAYPRLCYTSLSIHSSTIQTSPKLLANAALNVNTVIN